MIRRRLVSRYTSNDHQCLILMRYVFIIVVRSIVGVQVGCAQLQTGEIQDAAFFDETDPVSGDVPYLHANQKGAGRWTVVRRACDSVLLLQFHDGAEKSVRLGWEDGNTFLDGERWLRSCNPHLSVGPQCD